MYLLIIEKDPKYRALIKGRVQEAARHCYKTLAQIVELRHINEVKTSKINWSDVKSCFIGSGQIEDLGSIISTLKVENKYVGNIVLVLEPNFYHTNALDLLKLGEVDIVQDSDIPRIKSIIEENFSKKSISNVRTPIITFGHAKGGVGCSTCAIGTAAALSSAGVSTALLDLNPFVPTITTWGQVSDEHRKAVGRMITNPSDNNRLGEILAPKANYKGNLVIIGQPSNFLESFHYVANAIRNAPQISNFVNNIITLLKQKFDAIVIDIGNNWSAASIAAISRSSYTYVTLGSSPMAINQSIKYLGRFLPNIFGENQNSISEARTSLGFIAISKSNKLNDKADIVQMIQKGNIASPKTPLYMLDFITDSSWENGSSSPYEVGNDNIKKQFNILANLESDESSDSSRFISGVIQKIENRSKFW